MYTLLWAKSEWLGRGTCIVPILMFILAYPQYIPRKYCLYAHSFFNLDISPVICALLGISVCIKFHLKNHRQISHIVCTEYALY